MFKSIRLVSRFITVSTGFALAVCFGCSSTKSQLIGPLWSELSPRNLGGTTVQEVQENPELFPAINSFRFFSDNTCKRGIKNDTYPCKYSILDGGRIQIEFEGGAAYTGNFDNDELIINGIEPWDFRVYGMNRLKLYKW